MSEHEQVSQVFELFADETDTKPHTLPAGVCVEVRRILDRAARRLLDERLAEVGVDPESATERRSDEEREER